MLFAVHQLDPVGAGLRVTPPKAGRAQYGSHGRHCAEVLFVDEAQFARIERIASDPDTQGVEDGIAPGVAMDDVAKVPVLDGLIVKHSRRYMVALESLGSAEDENRFAGQKAAIAVGDREPRTGHLTFAASALQLLNRLDYREQPIHAGMNAR